MRNFLFFGITLLFCSCNYFKRDSAVTYNNSIIDIQSKILERMDVFANSFGTSDSATMTSNLMTLRKTIDSSLSVMQVMPVFDGNKELKEAGLHLFEFYKKVAEHDYFDLVNILKKTDFSEDDKNSVEEINKRIAKEEEPLDSTMKSAQESLSLKYGFKLDRTEKGK